MFGVVRNALAVSVMIHTAGDVLAQGPRPSAVAVASAVDSLAARIVTMGMAPAIGVAVVMDGKTILARSHGFADASRGIRADDRTLWYIASTSKSFTGFATSLLADEGVIRFDAPITSLLRRARWHADARPDTLTLARFLSHTHGLDGTGAVVMNAAFTGAIPEARWPELLVWSAPTGSADLVYSNLGYNVAAMVIDAVRPEGWRRFLEQRVYAPAGLRDTYARVSGLEVRIAKPHILDASGQWATTTFFKTDATMNSAGGHVSTLHDLARWAIVQMDSGRIDGRQVFPQRAVASSHRMLAPHTRPNAMRFAFFDRQGWAAGWDIGAYEGEPMVSRFGSYHTTRSHLSFLPRRRIGVVVETTGSTASTATDIIAAFAYDLEAGRPDARARVEERLRGSIDRLNAARRQAVVEDSVQRAGLPRLSSTELATFAGRYTHPGYGDIVFRVRDGGLHYKWGALYGPVDVADATSRRLQLNIAGSRTAVTFDDSRGGPAASARLQGITFTRSRD